tara:strand:+ start:350 stop:544 length:195 start_codon:yes stop_codon:yes gene_type:complete
MQKRIAMNQPQVMRHDAAIFDYTKDRQKIEQNMKETVLPADNGNTQQQHQYHPLLTNTPQESKR